MCWMTLTFIHGLLLCFFPYIACEFSGRYAFLVYNTSVHLYNVARSLIRFGTARYVVPFFQRCAEALQDVHFSEPPFRLWISRFLMYDCRLFMYSFLLSSSRERVGLSRNTIGFSHLENFFHF